MLLQAGLASVRSRMRRYPHLGSSERADTNTPLRPFWSHLIAVKSRMIKRPIPALEFVILVRHLPSSPAVGQCTIHPRSRVLQILSDKAVALISPRRRVVFIGMLQNSSEVSAPSCRLPASSLLVALTSASLATRTVDCFKHGAGIYLAVFDHERHASDVDAASFRSRHLRLP